LTESDEKINQSISEESSLFAHYLTHMYQRWTDCDIFQSESSPDSIKLNPIQSWSAKFLKIISPIQSWSAHVKLCILFCLMRQKHHWSYFAFSQIQMVEGTIVPAVHLPHEAKIDTDFCI